MKKFIRKVRNVIKWLPIIWNDRDSDYGYLYRVMIFKLRNMEEYFDTDGREYKEVDDNIKEMKYVRSLLEAVYGEKFEDMMYDKHTAEFSKPRSEMTAKEIKRERDIYLVRCMKANRLSEAANKNAFTALGKNIRKWWI